MVIKRYLRNVSNLKIRVNINGGVTMLTLSQIREKNRTSTTLIGSSIEPQEYSDELIKQCKEEFETFVKPIRDKVIGRMLGEK